jgi:ferric-dicitrate binding protein FerR (iron transport regulator)
VLKDRKYQRISWLIDQLLEEELDDAELQELSEQLKRDEKARELFAQSLMIHGGMHYVGGGLAERDTPRSGPRRYWVSGVVLAAGAALVALVLIPFFLSANNPSQNSQGTAQHDPTTRFVARLIEGRAVGEVRRTIRDGDWLRSGTLTVERGLTQMVFDSGSALSVRGHTQLRLTSPDKVRLDRGFFTARVPSQSPFVVQGPYARILASGATFSVRSAPAEGESRIYVLEGTIALSHRHQDEVSKILDASEAVRITETGISPIEFDGANCPPIPGVDRDNGDLKGLRWSFDKSEDKFSDAIGTLPGGPYPLKIAEGDPKLADGAFGKALVLDGQDDTCVSNFSGITGDRPRTVAFWVKIPESPKSQSYSILAWGKALPLPDRSQQYRGKKWQIAWNHRRHRGLVGALRVEFGGGYVVGSTDLRDGNWHHVAVLWLGGQGADVSTHLKIYVDGRLERISGMRSERIRTATQGQDTRSVMVGKNINTKVHGTGHFRGSLDEICIFKGALLPSEIRSLMRHNKIKGTDTADQPPFEATAELLRPSHG